MLLIPATSGARATYGAQLADSRWRSVSGEQACHLVHEIPLFGRLIVSQRRDGAPAATLVTNRPPSQPRLGRLYRRDPPWRGTNRTSLNAIQARPEHNAIALDANATQAIMDGLEAGDFLTLRFPDWDGRPIQIDLSPVRFRHALRQQANCLRARDRTIAGNAAGEDWTSGSGERDAAMLSVSHAKAERDATTGQVADPALPAPIEREIFFSRSSANVDRRDLDTIRAVARQLSNARYWSRITLTGHTDGTGSRSFNRALALARAIEIRNQLIQYGIAENRIEVHSAGATQPIAGDDDAYGRSRNRRVNLRVTY